MQISRNTHIIRSDFQINLDQDITIKRFVNSVVVFGDDITLIDTGIKGSEAKIFKYISDKKRNPSEIRTVILSHSHPDHIGAAAKIKEETGCRILAHEAEKEWFEDIELQVRERPVPGFFDLVENPVRIDGFLKDGQLLNRGKDITLKVIHSPGHSKGSINILFQEERILFTADSIPLKGDIPNYDDFRDLLKSLRFIKSNRDYDILLTSWTPPLTDKDEITKTIEEGEVYVKKIDEAVNKTYTGEEPGPLEFCKKVISQLGLPAFLAVPLVDRTLRSHLK